MSAPVLVGEVEVLPPDDVESKVVALQHLDGAGQAAAVTVMLSHSRTGLLAAIAAHDLPQIVEWKAKGALIQEVAKQLRLGKDMRTDAAEFVRRAERGLSVGIREGQKAGTIESVAETRSRSGLIARGSKSSKDFDKPKPSDFLTKTEMTGGRNSAESVFSLADGVSDEQFEEVINEARAEGNLSRANVTRKCRAKVAVDVSDPLIDAEVEPEPSQPEDSVPQQKRRLTKHDSTEMLVSINGMLNGIVESLPFIDPADIDAAENQAVIDNIRKSMGSIRKVLKEIVND